VSPDGVSGGSTATPVTHMYKIRNAGQSTITGLTLWIGDSLGERVSTVAGGDTFVLAPNDPPVFASVEVRERIPYDQVLMLAWTDADGKHDPESTGIRPPRHA
jgi:hypothetical protein